MLMINDEKLDLYKIPQHTSWQEISSERWPFPSKKKKNPNVFQCIAAYATTYLFDGCSVSQQEKHLPILHTRAHVAVQKMIKHFSFLRIVVFKYIITYESPVNEYSWECSPSSSTGADDVVLSFYREKLYITLFLCSLLRTCFTGDSVLKANVLHV